MIRAALLALAVFGIAAPVQAQDEPETHTGSRLREKPEPMKTNPKSGDDTKTRIVAKRFGDCVFDRRKKQAIQLLSVSDYWSIDYSKLGDAEYLLNNMILMEQCLGVADRGAGGVGMTISNTAIRGALVEAAYLNAYKDEDAPITLAADAPEFLENRYIVPGRTHDDALAAASFSDCVVYQAPAKAHAVLHTKPGTKDEKAAVMAIVPAVGKCIPSGKEMRLNLASIRAFLADGLWARAYYGKPSEVSGGSE